MADERIEDISGGTIATLAAGDLFVGLDVSDISEDADGTVKNVAASTILTYVLAIGNAVAGGTVNRILFLDGSGDLSEVSGFEWNSGLIVSRAGLAATISNTNDAASSVVLYINGNRSGTAANNDEAHVYYRLKSAGGLQTVGEHCWQILDVTDGAEEAQHIFAAMTGGVLTDILRIVGASGVVAHKIFRQNANVSYTPTSGAWNQTIPLNDGNHQSIDLGSTDQNGIITLTVPSSAAAGTLIIKQHGVTSRDITWAASSGTIRWLGTEPTWNGDTAGTYRLVSWRFDGTDLFIAATDATT